MAFAWFVARRYLTAQRRQAFISLISAVSILGVGVGVAAVIVALALMTGVQGEMRDSLVGATAHVYVRPVVRFDDIEALAKKLTIPGVMGSAPAVYGPAMIDATLTEGRGLQLKGIDAQREPTVTDIGESMTSGSLGALDARGPDDFDGIVLGDELASALGVQINDRVWITTAALTSTPGGLAPRKRPMTVVGTFHVGVFEVDQGFGLVTLKTAEELLRKDGPDQLQLRLANLADAPRLKSTFAELAGPDYLVEDWTDLNGDLYAALWLEKVGMALAVGLIVMVAALNIVASLVLLVMEKTRDIAILRTMGAPAAVIRRIFLLQGVTIGVIGTVAGTILGVVVSVVFDRYRIISMPAEVYQISYLPFRVQPLDVAIVVVTALVICVLATIYPSRQAGRVNPAEALRHG
jgi:lipoprotein-releasing system permease protein